MNFFLYVIVFCFSFSSVLLAVEPKTEKQKQDYSLGASLVQPLVQNNIEIDIDMLIQGIKDSYDKKLKLSLDEIKQFSVQAQQRISKEFQAKEQGSLSNNKKQGEDFLTTNAKKEGIKTLPSGLQYQILKEGKGKSPKSTDRVKVHYKGTLINGEEFDSSLQKR